MAKVARLVPRAGSTTDGKDVRRDHTLKHGGAPSAPQSFPILWWLNPAAARRTWRRDAGRLVDNPASRVDDRLMQPGSDLNSNIDGRIGLSSGKSKADVIKAKGIFFPGV